MRGRSHLGPNPGTAETSFDRRTSLILRTDTHLACARKAGCEMSVSNGTRTASIADQLVIQTGEGSAEFGEPIHYISGVFLITRIVKVDVT